MAAVQTGTAGQGRGVRRGMAMQVLTSAALSMTNFLVAGSFSFGGVLVDQLSSGSDDSLTLSTAQISWVAAVFNLGNMLGYVGSTYVCPLVGTIRIIQVCSPAVTGAWLLMAFSSDFWSLLVGRLLTGAFAGMCLGPALAYITEVSAVHVRGYLATLPIANGCLGVMCSYLLGWFLGWRRACFAMGVAPMVVQFLTALVLPRSAKWLISKGHPEAEAERSLRFFHGAEYDAAAQVREIRASLGDGHQHDASAFQVIRLLRHRHNLVPFLLALALYTFFVFSGGHPTSTFAPVILRALGGDRDPYLGSVLVGGVRVVGTLLALVIMDRLERRTLLMTNGVVGAAGCLATGLAFVYRRQLEDQPWVALLAMLVIVAVMSTGVCTLAFVMMPELLPNAIRSEVSGLCLLYFGGANFAMMYAFPSAVAAAGMAGLYWFFTGMHLLMFAFAKFCLPSTGGKSVEEIQKMFVKHTVQDATEPVHIHIQQDKEAEPEAC